MKMDAGQVNQSFELAKSLNPAEFYLNLKSWSFDGTIDGNAVCRNCDRVADAHGLVSGHCPTRETFFSPIADNRYLDPLRALIANPGNVNPDFVAAIAAGIADIDANGHPCSECGTRPGHETGCSQDLAGQLAASIAKGGR